MCVFLYSMKERAVTGITWLPGVEGQRAGLHCLSKATTQSLFPPLPQVTLSNNKKHNKNQRIKRGKQVNWTKKKKKKKTIQRVTAENVHTFLRFNQRRAEVVVPSYSGCLFDNTIRQCSTLRVPSPSRDTSELSNHTSGFELPVSFESVASQWGAGCSYTTA